MKRLLSFLVLLSLVGGTAYAVSGLVGVGSGPTAPADGSVTLAKLAGYFKLEDNDGNCSGIGGSALALNFATEGRKFFTITANCEITVTDPTAVAGQVVAVAACWTQGGAGGFTLALPANFRWHNGAAPAWGTTAGDDNCAFCYYRQTSDEYVCSGVADY